METQSVCPPAHWGLVGKEASCSPCRSTKVTLPLTQVGGDAHTPRVIVPAPPLKCSQTRLGPERRDSSRPTSFFKEQSSSTYTSCSLPWKTSLLFLLLLLLILQNSCLVHEPSTSGDQRWEGSSEGRSGPLRGGEEPEREAKETTRHSHDSPTWPTQQGVRPEEVPQDDDIFRMET